MTNWRGNITTAARSPHEVGQSEIRGGSGFAAGISKSSPETTSLLRLIVGYASAAWKWFESKRTQQLAARRMRVAETISLGEKRFVSILHVDGNQFLVAGAAGNVSLLAILNNDSGSDASITAAAVAIAEAKL